MTSVHITSEQFFKGRDVQFASELTPSIKANAEETLRRANMLLGMFYQANPGAARNRGCNSGWRPGMINRNTKGAAPRSHHMTAKAIDVGDDDEALDAWLMTPEGQKALEACGLWMEHPRATPRWAHLQIVPPMSGRRVFMP